MGLFNKDVKNENKALDTSATAVESRVNKRLYLVDYENVSDAGLDYKKVYDAFASCENASAYNNKLQKSLGNDKTSVVYKATSKIFENAKN